jgi:elongation factor Ts
MSVDCAQINSETDFVARNELFQDLVKRVSQVALTALPATTTSAADGLSALSAAKVTLADGSSVTVADAVVNVVAKVRENVVLRRVVKISVPAGNGFLAA